MALNGALFFLLHSLAEDVFVFRVGLREVVEAEALVGLHFATALVVALDEKVDAPFDVRRRFLPAASEKLIVLDFELADVLLDLSEIFVDGRHACKKLPGLHARVGGRKRQLA